MEPTDDDIVRNVVSSLGNSISNTIKRRLRRGKREEYEFNVIIRTPPLADASQVTTTAQRRLERKAFSATNVLVDLPQHQPAGSHRRHGGIKWGGPPR